MTMTPKMRQHLKAKAHKLKPVILIGSNGLTDAVQKEIDRALTDHELIKIRLPSMERDDKHAVLAEICSVNHAELVQLIGNIGVLFRANEE